ncbi:XkdW family protein [Paenibacillus contaminans]|uniref:Bacteriophage SP-beta YorD domain-containing protein n=1 Tax=Paenibacillus contaminans TaxID=450362 RepID=A0A329MP66_9BACL|nr:XkdW family protein [Paenibacillus contaminans]RAV19717.1 hypothetical protein DQG23_19900 [Paenibacillus contaminans]
MNTSLAIMKLFPEADPKSDFLVQDDSDGNGQYIAVWSLPDPKPTEAELQAAWDDLQANPPVVPPSIEDKVAQLQAESVDTMLALSEVYETTAQQDAMREQEGIDTMLALTEAYELILQQQATIDALMVRIEVLEGGAS